MAQIRQGVCYRDLYFRKPCPSATLLISFWNGHWKEHQIFFFLLTYCLGLEFPSIYLKVLGNLLCKWNVNSEELQEIFKFFYKVQIFICKENNFLIFPIFFFVIQKPAFFLFVYLFWIYFCHCPTNNLTYLNFLKAYPR